MSTTQFLRRSVVAVSGAALLASCGQGSISWTENVRSADGQLVILHRTTEFAAGGSGIADLTIAVPGQGPAWRSTRHGPQGSPETPLIFNLENNVPTIYTTLDGSGECGTYYRYQLTGHAWRPAPTSESMDQDTNLLLRVEPRQAHVTLADKDAIMVVGGYALVLRHVAPGACQKTIPM